MATTVDIKNINAEFDVFMFDGTLDGLYGLQKFVDEFGDYRVEVSSATLHSVSVKVPSKYVPKGATSPTYYSKFVLAPGTFAVAIGGVLSEEKFDFKFLEAFGLDMPDRETGIVFDSQDPLIDPKAPAAVTTTTYKTMTSVNRSVTPQKPAKSIWDQAQDRREKRAQELVKSEK